MGYYRGDGGNYYRGDPFLGGLLLAGAKKIGGALLRRGRAAGRQVRLIARELAPSTIAGAAGYEMGKEYAESAGAKPPKRYRRMNPLNPKALRRALRRSEGFEKFAARTVNALYRVIDGRKVRTFKKRTPSS